MDVIESLWGLPSPDATESPIDTTSMSFGSTTISVCPIWSAESLTVKVTSYRVFAGSVVTTVQPVASSARPSTAHSYALAAIVRPGDARESQPSRVTLALRSTSIRSSPGSPSALAGSGNKSGSGPSVYFSATFQLKVAIGASPTEAPIVMRELRSTPFGLSATSSAGPKVAPLSLLLAT